MKTEYKQCLLCARGCGVDRYTTHLGFCKSGAEMRICRADLHFWEEPIISGENGSGTVFFSGCSLGCVFCQNREISRAAVGDTVSSDGLADIMLSLEARGAHNINFVTPTHFAPSVIEAVAFARQKGLKIPIVYNTGSYDTPETVRSLDGTVDVYIPDFKYYRESTAKALASAPDYPDVAFRAISEMVKQKPVPVVEDGIMTSGVIIRILLLPGHLAEAKLALSKLFRAFGDAVYFSLMGQYTVMEGMKPPLNRPVTVSEYSELIDYADRLGIKNGFTQELSSSSGAYIPKFKV